MSSVSPNIFVQNHEFTLNKSKRSFAFTLKFRKFIIHLSYFAIRNKQKNNSHKKNNHSCTSMWERCLFWHWSLIGSTKTRWSESQENFGCLFVLASCLNYSHSFANLSFIFLLLCLERQWYDADTRLASIIFCLHISWKILSVCRVSNI